MLKRMVGVWLAGLGLVGASFGGEAAPKPTKEEMNAAQKKVKDARGAVNALARKMVKKDKELAAASKENSRASRALHKALMKIMATMPEAKDPVAEDAKIAEDLKALYKEMRARQKQKQDTADLKAKQKELNAQRNEIRKKLRKPRAMAMKDPSIAAEVKAASEARKAWTEAVRAKVSATPEGKKAIEEMDAADKAVAELRAKMRAAAKKRRGRKGGKGQKGKGAKK